MIHFVVDTNILFSYFKKNSATYKLIESNIFVLYAPLYAKEELLKYKNLILEKYDLKENEFTNLLYNLECKNIFYLLDDYKKNLNQFVDFEDQKDVEFLALALHLNYPLWSNDKLLTNQTKVSVFTTKDVFDLLDSIIQLF